MQKDIASKWGSNFHSNFIDKGISKEPIKGYFLMCISCLLREMLEHILRTKSYIHQILRFRILTKWGEKWHPQFLGVLSKNTESFAKGLWMRERLFCMGQQAVYSNNLWLAVFKITELIKVSYFGVPDCTYWLERWPFPTSRSILIVDQWGWIHWKWRQCSQWLEP